MGIRVTQQSDGGVNVTTTDGINLVSNTYAVLSYAGGVQNGTYGNIQIQDINPQTGQIIGQAIALDPHLSGGSLKGMIDMRDQTLGGLAEGLGNFAQNVAQAFNAQANANAAYPPPTSLTGRDTGLLAGDALNFSGKTTIAVTDASGTLVSRVDVDFDTGTLSVDGGGSASIGATIGSFAAALNTALGANGSAEFCRTASFRFPPMAATASWCRTMPPRPAPAAARASRNFSASTMSSPPRRLRSSRPGFRLRMPAGWRRAASSNCPSRARAAISSSRSASPPPPARPSAMSSRP